MSTLDIDFSAIIINVKTGRQDFVILELHSSEIELNCHSANSVGKYYIMAEPEKYQKSRNHNTDVSF